MFSMTSYVWPFLVYIYSCIKFYHYTFSNHNWVSFNLFIQRYGLTKSDVIRRKLNRSSSLKPDPILGRYQRQKMADQLQSGLSYWRFVSGALFQGFKVEHRMQRITFQDTPRGLRNFNKVMHLEANRWAGK